MYEKPGTENRTASAGWYNTAAFHKFAENESLYAKTVNGDAFSDESKEAVVKLIKEDLGQIDLLIYSVASPRRKDPESETIFNSVLKPIGKSISMLGLNTDKECIQNVELDPATPDEISATIKVMGGEDWCRWVNKLKDEDLLADAFKTTAFTYIGEKITWDLYWDGTIGAAKKDLDKKVLSIRESLKDLNGDARVSVLKAVVTQSSSAIPVMPLYLAILFKEMKLQGTNEGCIEQLYRLLSEKIYSDGNNFDVEGRFRVDDYELSPQVQLNVTKHWNTISDENLDLLADFAEYKHSFMKLFGFEVKGIDYTKEVNPERVIAGIINL
tara:strand:- start:28 stop:1008 length:981 start_codon:yes stop_codon:yes gene_type:complete